MSEWSPYVQLCACGHDKATHFFDADGPGDCLGMQCDCRGYHVPGTPALRNAYGPEETEPKKPMVWYYT